MLCSALSFALSAFAPTTSDVQVVRRALSWLAGAIAHPFRVIAATIRHDAAERAAVDAYRAALVNPPHVPFTVQPAFVPLYVIDTTPDAIPPAADYAPNNVLPAIVIDVREPITAIGAAEDTFCHDTDSSLPAALQNATEEKTGSTSASAADASEAMPGAKKSKTRKAPSAPKKAAPKKAPAVKKAPAKKREKVTAAANDRAPAKKTDRK